ncbi:hypothetical protein BC832DRAFT_432104 [Gaertneriomyces semiglobifer]|nr:hypothetical protein BC832DRAFT_432104 [Gaertneriomyces semiglobifer]
MIADWSHLGYEVVACTSHDVDCGPEALSQRNQPGNSQSTKGWQSDRFCSYPQTLVLRLSSGSCRIRQVDLLIHHFKIPTQVDFFIGRHHGTTSNSSENSPSSQYRRSDDKNSVIFSRIGYIELNDGVEIGYKARELRSVHMNAEGEFLKIVLYKCHMNGLNTYNQVGLVSISLLGEPCDTNFLLQSVSAHQHVMPGLESAVKNDLGIPDGGNVPRKPNGPQEDAVARVVEVVSRAKETAVSEERFADAKFLKGVLDKCNEANQRMTQLQFSKQRAIAEEDYDTAGSIKNDINEVKYALFRDLASCGISLSEDGSIIPQRVHPRVAVSTHEISNSGPPAVALPSPPPSKTTSPPKASRNRLNEVEPLGPTEEPPAPDLPQRQNSPPVPALARKAVNCDALIPEYPPPPALSPPAPRRPPPIRIPASTDNAASISPPRSPPALAGSQPHDPVPNRTSSPPIPTIAKKIQPDAQTPLSKKASPKKSPVRKQLQSKVEPASPPVPGHKQPPDAPSPVKTEGLPPGFDPPEPLSPAAKAEYDLPIAAFGPLIVQCLLGKQFGLKEWALNEAAMKVEQSTKNGASKEDMDASTFVEAGYRIVESNLEDKREKAVIGALALWEKLIAYATARGVSPAVSYKYVEILTPTVLSKTGDMNARVRQGCVDAMVFLAKAFDTMPYSVYPHVLRPFEAKKGAPVAPKIIKGRLEVVYRLSEQTGLSADSEKAKGISVPDVVNFTLPHLQHTSAEVREAAVKIVVLLAQKNGEDKVLPLLGSVKPQQMQIVQAKLAEAKGEQPVAQGTPKRPAAGKPWPQSPAKPSPAAEVSSPTTSAQKAHRRISNEIKKSLSRPPSSTSLNARLLKSASTDNLKTGKAGGAAPLPAARKVKKAGHPAAAPQVNEPISAKSEPRISTAPRVPKPAPGPSNETLSNNWNIDRTCIFCEEMNEGFTEENLDTHYWRDCPMLMNCSLCKLIVEIPMLTDHRLKDCDRKADWRRCPRCKEAVKCTEFAAHIATHACRPAPTDPGVHRCPLCHQDVPDDEDGWKVHLMQDGCPGSDRGKKKPSSRPTRADDLPNSVRPGATRSSEILRATAMTSEEKLQKPDNASPIRATAPTSHADSKTKPGVRRSMLPRMSIGGSNETVSNVKVSKPSGNGRQV